jgi:hypothetical protein
MLKGGAAPLSFHRRIRLQNEFTRTERKELA